MADIDKFLSGEGQQQYVRIVDFMSTIDDLQQGLYETLYRQLLWELTPKDKPAAEPPPRPYPDYQAFDMAMRVIQNFSEDTDEYDKARNVIVGVLNAALPPEEVHTGLDQRAGGEPTGGAEGASGAGEGLQSEDQGATIPYEAPHDRGSDPQDRTPQGS